MALVVGLLLGLLQSQTASAVSSLTIETSSGPVTGLINRTTPNVAQFLGIPYAEPPVGDRRWLPAIAKSRQARIDATRFGWSCPQFEGNGSSVWLTDVPETVTPPNTFSEDCLFVNVWAPYQQKEEKKKKNNHDEPLPIIAWIHGGAFKTGGGNIQYQIPSQWIERSQKHIVIGINYRLNIFGFPNAKGLKDDEQNLGFLDQRLALEWIRKNAANFGGDPARITLWGQSAGAASVDNYNYAYPKDPIVSGLIMDSGVSILPLVSTDVQKSNFSFVANHFGCTSNNTQTELDCFRNISSSAIEDFLKQYNDAATAPALAFNPVNDERTKFANVTARTLAGNFTKKPAIIGTNVNEGEAFLPYNRTFGPDKATADFFTLQVFLCPAVKTTQDRYAASASTFRFLYGGNFSNISPQWWEGAYHSAELPLIFGTHDIARSKSTPFEYAVSEKMQDYWVAFARDPERGLGRLGWKSYRPEGEAVLIGYKDVVSQPIKESRLDEACVGAMPRPGATTPP
ncbi:Alpha/Beta hydrolase protein [Dendryphion nanum]|uniref:Carboxylic ester hydrolase n=1 Tax=Dendryphion nanum TaxID=256645 RepID=A0A9P9DZ75_9PLEO|nr:Alpha/Beta hydrolase protein [Dendryphion nanum]